VRHHGRDEISSIPADTLVDGFGIDRGRAVTDPGNFVDELHHKGLLA
jgi:hypothetical protein